MLLKNPQKDQAKDLSGNVIASDDEIDLKSPERIV